MDRGTGCLYRRDQRFLSTIEHFQCNSTFCHTSPVGDPINIWFPEPFPPSVLMHAHNLALVWK
jgi:hypothetical protein